MAVKRSNTMRLLATAFAIIALAVLYPPAAFTPSDVNLINASVTSRSALRKTNDPVDGKFNELVYAFWFGSGQTEVLPMMGDRKKAFDDMVANIGVPVILVNDSNIANLTHIPDDAVDSTTKVHPAFQYLSAVQKADYLNGYFMHRFGGAFHDIKRERTNFSPFFQDMKSNRSIWMIGYPEHSRTDIACALEPAKALSVDCEEVKDQWRSMLGNCMGVFQPNTPLTKAWMDLMHRRLDEVLPDLIENPAPFARCCFNNEGGYPLSWNELKGGILHPLQFKLGTNVSRRALIRIPRIDTSGYRSPSEESSYNSMRNEARLAHWETSSKNGNTTKAESHLVAWVQRFKTLSGRLKHSLKLSLV